MKVTLGATDNKAMFRGIEPGHLFGFTALGSEVLVISASENYCFELGTSRTWSRQRMIETIADNSLHYYGKIDNVHISFVK